MSHSNPSGPQFPLLSDGKSPLLRAAQRRKRGAAFPSVDPGRGGGRLRPWSWGHPPAPPLHRPHPAGSGSPGKVSRRQGGRGRGAAQGQGSRSPAPCSAQAPITPIEPPHCPCVLGQCKTGTKVLRKDKGGGRGRWPGLGPRHTGRLGGGGDLGPRLCRTWLCQEVNLGPQGSRPRSLRCHCRRDPLTRRL